MKKVGDLMTKVCDYTKKSGRSKVGPEKTSDDHEKATSGGGGSGDEQLLQGSREEGGEIEKKEELLWIGKRRKVLNIRPILRNRFSKTSS